MDELERKILHLQLIKEKQRRLEKLRCKKYNYFFKRSWKEIEPTTELVDNWHIEYLCNELQTQAERIAARGKKEYDIIINIPPRSLKSSIVSRLFIAWVWTLYPDQRFLTASYSKDLALEHAVDTRSIILTPWYQRNWGNVYQMTGDQNVKSFYRTNKSGYRMAVSALSSAIGKGANYAILDDPNDPKSDESEVKRINIINWFLKVIYSRLNDQKIDLRIIVQQRTNEQDLTGYLLANYPTAYKLFCFPGEETKDISPPEIKKYYKNGLFFPSRFDRKTLENYKLNLRGDYSGQINQNPAPAEGNMFKRHWWRFWRPKGSNLPDVTIRIGDEDFHLICKDIPDKFEDKILSWDMGLKGKKENDPSCGDVWARTNADFYVLDETRGQFNDLQNEIEVRAQKQKHNDSSIILIEDAAAGVVVIRRLKLIMPGILEENPSSKGSKKTRARPFASVAETGNVYLPHPAIAPWVWDWIDEVCVFDRGTHDERVDCGSQAINYFMKTKRIFPDYAGETSPFIVAWQELSPDWKIYVSMFMEKNLRIALLVLLWNIKTGILRVLAECISETPNPDIIIPNMAMIFRMIGAENVDKKRVQWIGNDFMFSKGHGDVAGSYIKLPPEKRIFIRQTKNYNEIGAINSISRMISNNKLILHNRANLLSQEMLSWQYKETVPEKEGFLLSRALCLTTASIHEVISTPRKEKILFPYSKERSEFLDAVERITKAGNLDREYNLKGIVTHR